MQFRTRLFAVIASGLALSATIASAQLQLSGRTIGSFDDLGEANTVVNNAADGSWANFTTGIASPGSTQSRIEFFNETFTNVGSGEPIQVGLFNITNGKTFLGSGAPIARFNLGLELTAPEGQSFALTTINFHIDHTPNGPGSVPDTFSVSFDQPEPVVIQNTLVQFHVNVDPLEFPIAEDATLQKGDITVTFTPVPEPSTYAAVGSALLLGLVGYRSYRRRGTAIAA